LGSKIQKLVTCPRRIPFIVHEFNVVHGFAMRGLCLKSAAVEE
jgi:hypothetical protein